jgi:hypothetical protein
LNQKNKRVKLGHEESRDESFHLTTNQYYKIQINEVLDAFISHFNWRYTTLNEIANDFAFLSGSVIHDTEASELEKYAVDLAKKYEWLRIQCRNQKFQIHYFLKTERSCFSFTSCVLFNYYMTIH